MANILLTEKCVRSCPYCFAKEQMTDADNIFLAWEDLIYIIDLLEVSGNKSVSFLGGEPTLHPQFTEYVLYCLERGFHVNIFTSGIMSAKKLETASKFLAGTDRKKLSFVCNINHPDITSFAESENLNSFLHAFGNLVSPGYNIYHPNFDLDFLIKKINKYGLLRHIRIGMANPIPGQKNEYLAIKDMPIMIENLSKFLPVLDKFNISIGFDCGLPLCLFSEELIGHFFKLNNGRLSFGCGPAVDIGPDMSVWSCFPLSGVSKKSIFEFDSFNQIMDYYTDFGKKIRNEVAGIYEDCDTCKYRENGLCAGGCLAHIFNDAQNEPKIRIPEFYG